MDGARKRVVAVYSDSMTLIWDLTSKEKPKVMRAFLSHNASINDLEILPSSTMEITRFVTASSDKTIKFWNFYDYSNSSLQKEVKRNVYAKELEKIIYVSDSYDHFKVDLDSDFTDFEDKKVCDGQIKCLGMSPDGEHLA